MNYPAAQLTSKRNQRNGYSALPAWFSRQPKHPLVQQFWHARRNASPALPCAALRVTDDEGTVLIDVALARSNDYRLRVELASGSQVVDLYWHYLKFVIRGGKNIYRGYDRVAHTFVKFGTCMQDVRTLHLRIQPRNLKKPTEPCISI